MTPSPFALALAAALALIGPDHPSSASEPSVTPTVADTIPDWLREHMANRVAGTGRWITDNAAYRGTDEPVDAYGMEWAWGPGRQSIRGRLFGLHGDKEVGTYWHLQLAWHPGERRPVLYQFGGGGAVGIGPMDFQDGKIIVDQVFFRPDGSSFRTRHESLEAEGLEDSCSFDWAGGRWVARRHYVWRRTG